MGVAVALTVTGAAVGVLRFVAPVELLSIAATAASCGGRGICVLLTDAFFANVMMVPFTGEAAGKSRISHSRC